MPLGNQNEYLAPHLDLPRIARAGPDQERRQAHVAGPAGERRVVGGVVGLEEGLDLRLPPIANALVSAHVDADDRVWLQQLGIDRRLVSGGPEGVDDLELARRRRRGPTVIGRPTGRSFCVLRSPSRSMPGGHGQRPAADRPEHAAQLHAPGQRRRRRHAEVVRRVGGVQPFSRGVRSVPRIGAVEGDAVRACSSSRRRTPAGCRSRGRASATAPRARRTSCWRS